MEKLKQIHSTTPFWIHGSADSEDIDVFFLADESDDFSPAGFEKLKNKCSALSNGQVNGNIIRVQNGQVVNCFKGTCDEVNNGLFHTYHHHEQMYPNPVDHLVLRHVEMKWARATRGVISMCSRTGWRPEVKATMRSGRVLDRIHFLSTFDFAGIEDFHKGPMKDVLKFFCFQTLQYIGLLYYTEIFQKSEAAAFARRIFPDMGDSIAEILYRTNDPDKQVVMRLIRCLAEFAPSFDPKSPTQIETDFGILDLKAEKYI